MTPGGIGLLRSISSTPSPMPLLLKITQVMGSSWRTAVSTSAGPKPKAASPSSATTRLSGFTTCAASAKPGPTPIVPQVPASSRARAS